MYPPRAACLLAANKKRRTHALWGAGRASKMVLSRVRLCMLRESEKEEETCEYLQEGRGPIHGLIKGLPLQLAVRIATTGNVHGGRYLQGEARF